MSVPRPRIGHRPLAEVAGEHYDLVVIGGGITGAGVARHAAQAGLRTLLLEADDFAAGTSSRSTKLIHGGLRYLAMGDIALVREGVRERRHLLAMAPHLVEPRWMLVPAATWGRYLLLRIGIAVYERLGKVGRGDRHRNWQRAELAEGEPLLDSGRLPRACVYREYLTDDARLVLATLRAAAADGAVACNYARVRGIDAGDDGCRLEVLDEATGATHTVSARVAVNAAGPWVESLLPPADGPDPAPRLHLSKGVHLVVDRSRLDVRHMVMMTAADGRPVFAIARGGVTYVGTTDTTHHGGAELWPEVQAADIDYLLATVNDHFRGRPLSSADVLATWAGLRPLIRQPGKNPKEMSRRDEVWRQRSLVTVAGGKLTGFRPMAEAVMAAVGDVVGRHLPMPQPLAPLAGGDIADLAALREAVSGRYQLDPTAAERLVRLYGSEVVDVLGERPVPLTSSMYAEEVAWAADVEGARTLEDVVYRRLRAPWFLPGETPALLEPAADLLAGRLGWSDAERQRQLDAVRRRLADELAFRERA
ncbi:MAG: glycerol-3-phosphate dehydrogenase/oxidase [Pseudomonadales bacterium]